jgi:hypothetical protein
MCKPTTAEEFERARRLHELGVAVDYDAFERMRAESADLSIFQNSDAPSLILDMPAGQTGCVFNVAIANHSEREALAFSWTSFDGPEWLHNLRLIPDPRLTKGSKYPDLYFLRPDESGYPREAVLNNFVRRKQKLPPGGQADGFLLAIAEGRIPFDYADHDRIKVRLNIFDQRGRAASCLFGLRVERGPEHRRVMKANANRSTWRRLFEPEDEPETLGTKAETMLSFAR